nr:PREDICTED: bromodomain adjacent to zinc finger domain protein 2A [Lepisosteus oculatus]
MEADNHFNFGGHPSAPAGSGLKLSSGESLYTNGSSMSFPQQAKNLNGDLNVNGITTVIGTSAAGSHISSHPSYSLMGNHQTGLGYDYLWNQSQYVPAMGAGQGAGPGVGVHHKQSPGGGVMQLPQQPQQPQPQPQQQQQQQPAPPQQHFQGHAQYQLNGGVGAAVTTATAVSAASARQAPAAAAVAAPPPNVTLRGAQYWNSGSPSHQQSSSPLPMSYNSHGVYGTYPSQVHAQMPPAQHHQQQPQPLPHHHHHHHHQPQQQQQQHYGMVTNGMPYYPMSQPQRQMMTPPAQAYSSPHGSPQHVTLSRSAAPSPLPVPAPLPPAPVTVPVPPPVSAAPENGGGGGGGGPLTLDSTSGMRAALPPSVTPGHMSSSYNGMERVAARLPPAKTDVFAPDPAPLQPVSEPCHQDSSQHALPSSGRSPTECRETGHAVGVPVEAASRDPDHGDQRRGSQLGGASLGSPCPLGAALSQPSSPGPGSDMQPAAHPAGQTARRDKGEGPVASPASLGGSVDGPPRDCDSPDESSQMAGSLDDVCDTEDSMSSFPCLLEDSGLEAPGAGESRSGGGGCSGEGSPQGGVPGAEEESLGASSAADDSSLECSALAETAQNESVGDSLNEASQAAVSLASASDNAISNASSSCRGSESEEDQDAPGSVAVSEEEEEQWDGGRRPVGAQVFENRAAPSLDGLDVAGCDGGGASPDRDSRFSQDESKSENGGEEAPAKVEVGDGGEEEEEEEEEGEEEEDWEEEEEEEEEKGEEDSEAQEALAQVQVSYHPSSRAVPLPLKAKKREKEVGGEREETGSTTPTGEVQRRRIATEEQVRFPLLHGWRREIRIRRSESRLKGETWYYSPCGKRMKQFPEVIKYLNRHQGLGVTREHFSFSPRMPVGDFFEERETPEGVQWVQLADEEVPSMIMAITGKRGRPPNPDKEKPRARARGRDKGGCRRRPGRPPKTKMVDLLSKVDARLLKRLEAQETLSEEDKEKLNKIKKKMKRKARNKRKQDAKNKKLKLEKKKAKLEKAREKKEDKAAAQEPGPEPPEAKKRRWRRRKETGEKAGKERVEREKRGAGRGKAKAEAQAQALAQAEVLAETARKLAEKKALAQRRQEERRRQQLILEELRKPTEDMCITDHQPLPEFSRIPGLVLSGRAFSHCLTVVEFLHSYGKVLGLDVPKDVPSLGTLQEGLLGMGDSQGEVQDLLVKLLRAALHDPGLPPYYQSVKILGDKVADLDLNRSSVSEGLRIFLEAYGFEAEVCDSLRTKPFQAHPPDVKAAVLAFLVDELNGSNIVISEIDSTLENMATYRKNKWIIEGKLRRLKVALARKTGRSEVELCLEDRRRSARVAEEESLTLEESGPLERSGRRARKEDAKLSEGESPSTASVPELERQIDKLTKRQVFFRKKLLQCSHSLRAVSLGQDRYRRRYWVLPHVGGVLVEGPEEIQGEVVLRQDSLGLWFWLSSLPPPPPVAVAPQPLLEDPLPGEASLMSSPRSRGRPRKIKPEVELHLRAAKNRRRRRSSKAAAAEDTPEPPGGAGPAQQDLNQSAFLSWLSQSQGSPANGEEAQAAAEDSVKEMAEKRGQWFNLLPKTPCDPSSLSQAPSSGDAPPSATQASLPAHTASLLQCPVSLAPSLDLSAPLVCSTPLLKPDRRRRRRGSSPAQNPGDPSALGFSLPGGTKRRGRPPSKLLRQIEQKYFTQLVAQPIPAEMRRGWWWIRDPEELAALLRALHPRGIREKALHKHLSKHMEFLSEVCTRPKNGAHTQGQDLLWEEKDPIFQLTLDESSPVCQAMREQWDVCARTMEMDLHVLQWVEDVEQRVLAADLQLKMVPHCGRSDTDSIADSASPGHQGWTLPELDSTREDLQYHEHKVDPADDWIIKTKKEWSDFLRLGTNPLDVAVLRLAALERNIERRYLKEPLWNLSEVQKLAPLTPPVPVPGEEPRVDVESVESEITPRLRLWRQSLDRCRSAAQLALCLLQLERAIAWERSVVKVTCLVCRKGDNDESLLLCDGCDRGCHMYCLRPKMTAIPEGDWFCPVCISKANGESPRRRKQPSRGQKRRGGGWFSSGSSEEDESPRRGGGSMQTRRREGPSYAHSRYSGDSGHSPSKRRRMATRNQPDLTYCEIILMEMESHSDAWPFLEPVNPRLVPGYRRIIKNPMDFLTMRERLLQGGYCSCEEFAADAQLVFDNCQLFNEDTSEVGMAGHSMRKFFESRWAEFYQGKDK